MRPSWRTVDRVNLPGFARRWLERRAARHGPHAALFAPSSGEEWVSLDLETTGLDPARDEILSIGAVRGCGRRVRLRDRFELMVRSDSARIGEAVRHHRIRPVDVAAGVAIDEALEQLLDFLGNRPLVGYCIAFDRAMLDRALRPHYGFGLPNRLIELRERYRRHVQRIRPEHAAEANLDVMASELGLPLFERHTALGDAITAALVHIRLQH